MNHPLNRISRTPRSNRSMRRGQQGASLISLVVIVVLLALAFLVGARVLPTFIEYRAIQSAVKKAHDSGTTVAEIQKAYDRSSAIDDITSVTAKDLDIAKVDDQTVVSFAYTKKVPLFGPVSLSIDYSGSSKSL